MNQKLIINGTEMSKDEADRFLSTANFSELKDCCIIGQDLNEGYPNLVKFCQYVLSDRPAIGYNLFLPN